MPRAPSAPSRPKAPTPTTALDPLVTKLTALGLDHPANCLPELVEQAARESLSPVAFLELVRSGELDLKDERRVTTMLKLSGLPPGKIFEDFDWSFQTRADWRQIEARATCAYLREKTNVRFLGPLGVGKSHLGVALGVKAIKNAFSVAHFVLDDLMHVLRADAGVPPARLRAKRYGGPGLSAGARNAGEQFRTSVAGIGLLATIHYPRSAEYRENPSAVKSLARPSPKPHRILTRRLLSTQNRIARTVTRQNRTLGQAGEPQDDGRRRREKMRVDLRLLSAAFAP